MEDVIIHSKSIDDLEDMIEGIIREELNYELATAEPERVNQVTMLLTKLIKKYKSFIERLEEFHSHDLECISSNKESLKYWENVKQLAFPSIKINWS